MAAVASRAPYSSNMPSASHYRMAPPAHSHGHAHAHGHAHGMFTSPTESEFSDSYRDGPAAAGFETVQDWDEARVGDWLRSINCAQYVDLFRRNNINGENLMDMDQNTLKDMGVKKIGDRVRIGAQAKVFRSNVYKRQSKRQTNRSSLATLDSNTQLTPPPSASPRPLHSARSGTTSRAEKRLSRQLGGADVAYIKSASRPGSPMIDQENRARPRHPVSSPMESARKEQSGAYFAQAEPPARYGGRQPASQTPMTARFAPNPHANVRPTPSLENINTNIVVGLPADKPLIRVIFETGRYSVVNIDGFQSMEDIMRTTLKKGSLNENHHRSYRFWVLSGDVPDSKFCRPLGEPELIRLCQDGLRSERGRLMLRKIHAGEPEGEQLRAAARIPEQQMPSPPAIEVQNPRSRTKLKTEQLIGEPLAPVSYPMSPASQAERQQYFDSNPSGVGRTASQSTTASARARKLKDFYGARPPTELITQDLQSYFPEVAKEEMDRTVRMSIRRSKRISKAFSRLSTMSNFSMGSGFNDTPPLPTIADMWRDQNMGVGGISKPGLRPLSVVRLGRPNSGYRESITSSILEPLDEESPLEPSRKSYVSFSNDSGSDGAGNSLSATDPTNNTAMQAYYDDTVSSSPPGTEIGSQNDSLNSRLSQFIAEDGEEADEELIEHLEKDSWEGLKYMKGAMIGQGSFGTVFLALHAVTAELMAVKQVEMPSNSGTAMDAKKNNMIEALKHEISLLRDLKHKNIVQYLGSNSDEDHLNIFLEYVAGGSVATMLVNYGSLPEGLIQNFVRQILDGLAYLHASDIIHRDIKGANILVDNKGTVKISDFGISKRVEASTLLHPGPQGKRGGPRVSLQGSVFWMAPEVVRQTVYTKKADIWSLGCLVVEMFTGSHPHPNCTQLQAIFKIGGSSGNSEGARPDLPDQASEAAKAFLRRTFEIEHEKRPTAEELSKSEFCNEAKA